MVANHSGYIKGREAGECMGQYEWEKADWCNYFNEEVKENTQRYGYSPFAAMKM